MSIRSHPSKGIAPIVAMGVFCASSLPVQAQQRDTQKTESAAVERELADMRAQMQRMADRIEALESQLAQANTTAAAAQAKADIAVAKAESKNDGAVKIAWKGAPEISGTTPDGGGWSFKPRGRAQFDVGSIDGPGNSGTGGISSELRRFYIGFDGTLPGGFGYRVEADLGASTVNLTDVYLTYKASKALTLTVGQHKPFRGIEELQSDLFTTMMERAAFTSAFGFERQLGVSGQYAKGPILVQAGVFSDNVVDLPNRRWSVDGRAVFMPKAGDTQFHIGGSLHYARLKDSSDTVRYRARPFLHLTDRRFVDTGALVAERELGIGTEAAVLSGRFHAVGEAFWQKAGRVRPLADPTFFGGYAEVGYFLTKGDRRGYGNGVFDRVKPANPVGKGGIGAIEFNLRYDRLDLSDAGIVGGRQNGYALSVVWTPTDNTRFTANYGHMEYDDGVQIAPGGVRNYGADAFGMRAQVDF